MSSVTFGDRIGPILTRLGWTKYDLSHHTLIHINNLNKIMDGSVEPTHNQLMIIINKINKHSPPNDHWRNYVEIVLRHPITDKGDQP